MTISILSIFLNILMLFGVVVFLEFVLLCTRLGFGGFKELYRNRNKIALAPSFSPSKNSRLKILIVGDSTATGSGAKREESIAGRLSFKFNASVRNLGQNGAKFVDLMKQMDRVANEKFDLVLIQGGNNDILRFTALSRVRQQVYSLFEKASNIGEHVVMLRGGNMGNFPFFPLSISWVIARRSRQVREICQKIAKEKGVLYVELFMQRKNDIFLKNPSYYYTPDLIHLNGNGYHVWFDYLMKEMERANYFTDSKILAKVAG